MDDLEVLAKKIKDILPHLDERQKRIYLASEARALGWGGIEKISSITGIHRNTIAAGMKDLDSGVVLSLPERADKQVRQPGGGRKNIDVIYPEIKNELEKLVDGNSYGNPENPLRWTTKSLRNLADELNKKGFKVSHTTVGTLLEEMGFSLQVNQKMEQVGTPSPDRDKQFGYINERAKKYILLSIPVISIDCKKKEKVGNFKNNGAEYAPKKSPVEVLDHDFELPGKGKAVPFGIYDVANNEGYVNVGISKDTSQFAVNSIRMWWYEMGIERYPEAKRLYITADCGGSNGSRSRLWKKELQDFANETNLEIEVSHFPPGTSKWNKIEHRMFSQISKNWRGRPLESLQVIISLIASTTTEKGLVIKCGLDESEYASGIKITDEELEKINISKDDFHGEWNYVISPSIH